MRRRWREALGAHLTVTAYSRSQAVTSAMVTAPSRLRSARGTNEGAKMAAMM